MAEDIAIVMESLVPKDSDFETNCFYIHCRPSRLYLGRRGFEQSKFCLAFALELCFLSDGRGPNNAC